MNELYCIALYTSVGYQTIRTRERFGGSVSIFQSFLTRATFLKVALSKPLDEQRLPARLCFFPVRVPRCLLVGRVKERGPVNAYGWNVQLWLCNDYHSLLTLMQVVYYYSVVESSLFTGKKKTKLLHIIYCLKVEKKHFVVLLWLLYVFYLFLRWTPLQSSKKLLEFYYVSKWCTFVGMPVMCSDMLQNSMHGVCSSIKTRNWYPVIKGYVVVFQATPPLCSLGHAESPRARCWLRLSSQIS